MSYDLSNYITVFENLFVSIAQWTGQLSAEGRAIGFLLVVFIALILFVIAAKRFSRFI